MDATTRDAIVKTSMTASKPASPFNQKIPDFPGYCYFIFRIFVFSYIFHILNYILLLHYSFAPAIAIPCSR